ncbi:MAG: hypothetical protein ISQ09_05035 [Rubripirellula sp.]|jgi:hypothetical protein|nr:hypothetical protein [Rubripirellula sp.]
MRNADEILNNSFLEVRAKLLEVAATLDRIERALGEEQQLEEASSASRAKIDEAIKILLSSGDDRAERLQHLFSREYAESWRNEFGI